MPVYSVVHSIVHAMFMLYLIMQYFTHYCSNSAGIVNSCLVLPAAGWLLSASLLFSSSGFFSFLGCLVSTSIVTCMHTPGQRHSMPPSQSRVVPLLHNCGNLNPPAHHSSIRRPSSPGICHSLLARVCRPRVIVGRSSRIVCARSRRRPLHGNRVCCLSSFGRRE